MHWPYFIFFYGNEDEISTEWRATGYDGERKKKNRNWVNQNVSRINEYISLFLLPMQYINDYPFLFIMVFLFQLLLMLSFFLLDTAPRITTNKGCDWKWQTISTCRKFSHTVFQCGNKQFTCALRSHEL